MWFNNAQIFNYQLDETISFSERLRLNALKPCPPHARFIHGWVETINEDFAYQINGSYIVCFSKRRARFAKSGT